MFYVGAALYNLIYNSNNYDGKEKKIITNNEKNTTHFQQNQDRMWLAIHKRMLGVEQLKAASLETGGCVSLHIANEV